MKTALMILHLFCLLTSCSGDHDASMATKQPPQNPPNYKYLALGDSYTIGQSVCGTCNFPEQLKSSLASEANIELRIIATTGWTTTNLKSAISTQNPSTDYDLVTLLIGVNNQYQHKPFALYEQEFPELVSKAIALAKGDASNVIVISIPDYRYTPFGNGLADPETVSQEIDQYNGFAAQYCLEHHISFLNITDITRMGLENPALVATDGLHPSELAYSKFVERLRPKALALLSN